MICKRLITPLLLPIARGAALFLALFSLLNIAGSHLAAGFDANIWWIDLTFLPASLGSFFLMITAAALLCFAIGFPDRPATRRFVVFAIVALLIAVLRNVATFYRQWELGRIHPGVPIPMSLFLAASLGLVLVACLGPWRLNSRQQRGILVVAFTALLFIFPLAQMYCFGKTDYRRPADAIVVFGARTYADGTLSAALYDRTRTAIDLYHQNLAPLLIFSGGPGDGATSEPQAMRNLAIARGVPASAIILDEDGLNTGMTVNHTMEIFDQRHIRKVLAVSHFYHLPRVKLAYARALAIDDSQTEVLTVPAEQGPPLPRMPVYMAREIAAVWTYYLRPLQ